MMRGAVCFTTNEFMTNENKHKERNKYGILQSKQVRIRVTHFRTGFDRLRLQDLLDEKRCEGASRR